MTFSIPITVTNVDIQNQNITLTGIVCSSGTASSSEIFWDTPNANKDSADYCLDATTDTATELDSLSKTILRVLIVIIGVFLIICAAFLMLIFANNNFKEVPFIIIFQYYIFVLIAVILMIALVNYIAGRI